MNDLKIIRHTGSRINNPDVADTEYPYRVEVNLRPPEFMQVTFVMMHGGSEEAVVRCRTRAAADRFIADNDLREHPRLRWIRIDGPEGREEIRP